MDERERISEAMIDVVIEHGAEEATMELVVDRAGVDRAAFERHFANPQDCILRTYWEHAGRYTDLVNGAFEQEEGWRDSLRMAAYASARFIQNNPRIVRFGTIQMFQAGPVAQAARESLLHQMVDLIDAGRQELKDPGSVGRGVAEGVLGSIYELIIREVQAERDASAAVDYVPELMYLAVRPYLGHEVAREELTIPPPPEGDAGVHRPAGTKKRQRVQKEVASRYGPRVSKAQGPRDEAALRLARLPPGRHGLPREFVAQNQRDRLAAGIIATVAERGLNEATITQISAAAGVSRRTFYAYFSSKEECYFAAYDTIVEHVRAAADAAAAQETEWPRQVGAKLAATLEFLAVNPDLARFCLIAPQRAGEEVAARYRTAMGEAVAELCRGMPASPATKAPSEAVAISLIGGMVALIARKVNAGEGSDLPTLLPELLELFLTPFLGRAEAVQVAQGSF